MTLSRDLFVKAFGRYVANPYGNSRAASDMIVDFFDFHFDSGHFDLCDAVINDLLPILRFDKHTEPHAISIILVVLLHTAYPARKYLRTWNTLSQCVYDSLCLLNGVSETNCMISGLM